MINTLRLTSTILFFSASEHLVGESPTPKEDNHPYILMRTAEFTDIFKKCAIQSMDNTEKNHKKTLNFSRFGKDILKCVLHCKSSENINQIPNCLSDNLYHLFKSPILTPYDREIFFAKVHEVKTNEELQKQFIENLGLELSHRVSIMFYQCFLREIVESLLAHMIVINEKEFECKVSKHSSTEQEILYYIGGFIVKKVNVNIDKLRCLRGKETILSFMTNSGEESSWFEGVKSWTKALDRGGLQYPSMNFYLLVREIDSIVSSKLYEETLSSNSLMKSKTKDTIFDSYIVNYHWGKILMQAGSSDAEGKLFLEYIIDVFLNVKGFAIARNIRQRETAKYKQSSSFRKSLQK